MEPLKIASVQAQPYTIPTDSTETDGTASWTHTTIVIVHIRAGNVEGMGYTYREAAAASLINGTLGPRLQGTDAFDTPAAWRSMQTALRNAGRPGIGSTALSAIDIALWDLKAKYLKISLAGLLGRAREFVPIYGSGGFTSYDDRQVAKQLCGWVKRDGCRAVKMKIGSQPERDAARVGAARAAIGDDTELFVDANGAYTVKQAICLARIFAENYRVHSLEEPVSSDDLDGLARVRGHVPAPMEVAAGEYAYDAFYVRRMLEAGAVDVQQADATRCGGITGFMQAAALCEAHQVDLSAHCAPAIHVHLGAAAPRFRHCEWFHDHVRVESLLFEGAPVPKRGCISPDLARPGLGLTLKTQDAERYAAHG